jgi:outer membrane lipoprotein-sorting protein
MKTTQFLCVALAAVVVGVATIAMGQGMMGRGPAAPGEQLAKLFGKNTAFSADANVTIKDPSGKELPAMDFSYAMLDGKVRTDMDMAKVHGGGMSAQAIMQMRAMGMDHIAHIFLPEKKVAYMIYPGMKAYCQMDTSKLSAQKEVKEPKIEKTELGKETVEGHPCVKSKVVITQDDGKKFESLQWQATDLKDFPVKSEMTTDDGTVVTTLFKNINQSKPDASLFVPPTDFKRYDSMQELMMANMQRMAPPGLPAPQGGMPRDGNQ